MDLSKLKPEKCKVCKQYKQVHFKQTYYCIAEYDEESKEYGVTYKVDTGHKRELILDCNDSSCKGSESYVAG